MSVDSIKHGHADRPHIPSQEEAGYEDASPSVQGQARKAEYPTNPVVTRGQDPELFWLGKYGEDDADDRLAVDIRSLYRTEHVAPEAIIQGLHRVTEAEDEQPDLFNVNALFGNAIDRDELSKVSEYYGHRDGWSNRLIQGDSLLVMSSLLEREGMAGQVQMCYIDPPYGIKYGSNWQMKLNSRTVTDGKDEHVSGEPEVIKAYRDTWELGIHSYLSYLRDRLLITRELLTETGSVFVQISDENVHLVRNLLDEVFGSENFVSQIFTYVKTSGTTGSTRRLLASRQRLPPVVRQGQASSEQLFRWLGEICKHTGDEGVFVVEYRTRSCYLETLLLRPARKEIGGARCEGRTTASDVLDWSARCRSRSTR